MANTSSAAGNVKVVTNREEAMKAIIKTFERCANTWYNTVFSSYEYEFRMGEYSLIASFNGNGRWVYENNISSHFRWCIGEKWLTPEEVEVLENEDFIIEYDFTDYEPGCKVFYEALCDLIHKKGTPLEATEYVEVDSRDLDMSWGNRLKLEAESEDTLVEWLLYMEPTETYQFLEEEKESLEDYFRGTLENHAEYCKKLYHSDDWNEILKKYEQGKNEAEGGTR